MRRFSELGIKQVDDKKIFNCQQVSISDVINCEIEVLDFVKFRQDGQEGKFFTNSSAIKSVLDQIPKDEFPFLTTIRSTKLGSSGKMYQFT